MTPEDVQKTAGRQDGGAVGRPSMSSDPRRKYPPSVRMLAGHVLVGDHVWRRDQYREVFAVTRSVDDAGHQVVHFVLGVIGGVQRIEWVYRADFDVAVRAAPRDRTR